MESSPLNPLYGAIILYPVNAHSAWSSIAIAIGELLKGKDKSLVQYSHCALFDHDGYQLEAVWPRIARTRISKSRRYEIWQVQGIDLPRRVELMNWAYSQIGKSYDIRYILSFGLRRHKNQEVCCSFIGDAYRKVGIHFPAKRPNQLAESSSIIKVTEFIPK